MQAVMTRMLLILGVALIASGCTIVENATRTLIKEPCEYCLYKDRRLTTYRDFQAAGAAWCQLQRNTPEQSFTADYEDGFICGYADYLYAGGNGTPPAAPPRRYWNVRYQNPRGYEAIQDWFAGFAHGATQAQEAVGDRRLLTVPSSAPLPTGLNLQTRSSSDAPAPHHRERTEALQGTPENLPEPLPNPMSQMSLPLPVLAANVKPDSDLQPSGPAGVPEPPPLSNTRPIQPAAHLDFGELKLR